MDNLNLFIPITKVDAAKRLVYGIATAEQRDTSGEVCDYATTKPYYEKWSESFVKQTDGKSFGNVRAMHGKVAAGKLSAIHFNDEAKQIEVCAKIVDDAEWAKVEEGVYTGFSQGGRYVKRWDDPGDATLKRYTAEPSEVSLVDLPCLSSATFSVIKADGSTELRKFKAVEPNAPAPTEEEVLAKAKEIAKAAGNEALFEACIGQAKAELSKAAAPAADKPKPEDTPRAAADGEFEQVWVSKRLPGKEYKTKAELKSALLQLDADIAAQKIAAPVLEALKGVADALDTKDGGAPAKTASETPADPAQKSTFTAPASPTSGLAAASTDGATTARKRRVTPKREKPAAKAGGADDLAKAASLYRVADMIQLLASLESAEESLEYPDYYGSSAQVPKALTDRFGALVVEFGDIVSQVLDAILAEMKAEEASEALAMGARVADLVKVGARNSKTDGDRISKVHDLAVELGASCGTAKGTEVEDMAKAQAVANEAAFKTTIAGLETILKDMAERVKKIEATPMPGQMAARVVTKQQDGGFGTAASVDQAIETLMSNPDALATLMIKAAQKQPMQTLPSGTGR